MFERFVRLCHGSKLRQKMSSSFQKCAKTATRSIPGTKLSPLSVETVLSCGVSALDHILGGGLPLGGILLVEEDAFGVHHPSPDGTQGCTKRWVVVGEHSRRRRECVPARTATGKCCKQGGDHCSR